MENMKKKIGVIGSGVVGQTLARGFAQHGYAVMISTREPAKRLELAEMFGQEVGIGTPQETADFGEIIVVAVKGLHAEEAVRDIASDLAGKIVIDVTNPIMDEEPENGVLKFFTSLDESLMERLERIVPEARFVKAFNNTGSQFMVDPDFGDIRPTMFLCGNDGVAKKIVVGIVEEFGWEAEDMGMSTAARAIEPLCMLWCIPGFLHNEWSHVFKLLKK